MDAKEYMYINHLQLNFLTYIFVIACIAFILTFKHFLSTLICLEFMTLIIYISISFTPYFSCTEIYNAFFFLSIAVCEAALGLTLVVIYVRKKGNDILKPF